MGEINSRDFPEYEKCYNNWVTNKNVTDEISKILLNCHMRKGSNLLDVRIY